MLTQTKYFGEIDYQAQDILHFPNGLFGFEEEKQFLLLPFAGSDANLLCLQSLETAHLAFVMMNPFALQADYAPLLPAEDLKTLSVTRSEDLCYYVLCVVRDPIAQSTVNLKCPVVINDESRQAMQVILDTNLYDMRHLLSEFESKGGETTC